MSTIFISHSSKDNEIAKELGRRLAEQNHVSVFLDLDPEKGIVAGQSWERTLYRKLRACRAVIVLCTDNYLTSHWCFAEIALARMEGKHLIALQVDPLSPDANLPSILTEKQFIDLRKKKKDKKKVEEGYRRLWRGLEEMDLLGVSNEWDPKQSPYLGLSAYQERHAPVFFGRDDETRVGLELLDRGAPGLIMVLGASGSGKSSLVRAGMVPRLRRDSDRWLVVGPFRPRRNPFAELAVSLAEAFQTYARDEARSAETQKQIRALRGAGSESSPGLGAESAAEDGEQARGPAADQRLPRLLQQLEELRQSPPEVGGSPWLGFLDWNLADLRRICGEAPREQTALAPRADELVEIADHLRRASGHREARVLLVIDQFEELLGHEDSADDANRFLDLLRNAIETEHSPLMALGTMRSDFLGLFQRNRELLGIDFESLSVGPMSVDGMRRVIEEPAKLGAIELEEGLADSLLEDTETPDALPLLSFTLSVLWNGRQNGTLTVRQYQELDGLHGAVAREAEAVLDSARRQGKEDAVRRAFLQMARLTEDGSYARLPVSWDREEVREVEPILEDFEKRRLLVTRMEKGEHRTVEVAHEALFRSWSPLKTWLDDHRGELLLEAQLRRDAQAWEENNCAKDNLWRGGRLQQAAELMRTGELGGSGTERSPEERFVRAGVRRRRIQRGTLAGITVCVFAVLAGFLWYAVLAKREAEKQTEEATARKLLFASQNQLGVDNDLVLLLAIEGARIRPMLEFDALLREGLLARGQAIQIFEHDDRVTHAVWDKSGSRIVSASYDETARVWDVESGRLLTTCKTEGGLDFVTLCPDGKRVIGSGQWILNDTPVWSISGANGEPLPEIAPYMLHAAWSPDESRLVTTHVNGDVLIYDSDLKQVLALSGHVKNKKTHYVSWNSDASQIVTASDDGTARVWDAGTGEQLFIAPAHELDGPAVTSATWSPDDKRIATASVDHSARILDAQNGAELLKLAGHSGPLNGVSWNLGGTQVVTTSDDGTARLWDADSGALRAMLAGHTGSVLSAEWNKDETLIVTTSEDKTARLWDAGTGQEVARLTGHKGPVKHAAWSPDSRHILTTSWDGTVRIWDPQYRGPLPILGDHEGTVWRAPLDSTGKRIVTQGAKDGKARVWDIESGKKLLELKADPTQTNIGLRAGSPAWSADDRRLLTVGGDKTLRVWDTETGDMLFQAKAPDEIMVHAAWNPQSKRIVTSNFLTANIWDATKGALIRRLEHSEGTDAVFHGAWNASGTHIVTTSTRPPFAQIWNAATGDCLELKGHDRLVWRANWSPDGKRLVTAGNDNTARVWEATDGTLLKTLEHSKGVYHAAWNSTGSRVATVCDDKIARVWDPDPGSDQEPLALVGHAAEPRYVAWSPDDKLIVTAGNDGTARIWDAQSGSEIATLLGHSSSVRYVAWNAAGDRVITAGEDGTARMHYVSMQDLLDAACERVIRNMTRAEWEQYMGDQPYRETCPGKRYPTVEDDSFNSHL